MVIPARSNRRYRNGLTEQSPVSAALRALEEAYKEVDARKSETFRRGMLPDSPTLVDHGPLRVLVSASPTPESMDSYIRNLNVHNVTHVVRVCEEFYSTKLLTDAGFQVHDWFFPENIDNDLEEINIISEIHDAEVHLTQISDEKRTKLIEYDRITKK